MQIPQPAADTSEARMTNNGNELADLEPIQYEDLYHEDDVPLADVRENALRLLVYVGLAVSVAVVVLGFTVQLSRQLTFDFTLKGDRQEAIYRFFDAVYLEETFVEVGDAVEAGMPLVRISSPEIVEAIAAYEAARARQQVFEANERAVYLHQIEVLGLEAQKWEEAVRSLEAQREIGAARYASEHEKLAFMAEQAARDYERDHVLFEKNLISEDQLRATRQAQVAADAALAALVQSRRQEVAALEQQVTAATYEEAIRREQAKEKQEALTHLAASLENQVRLAYETLHRNYGAFEIDGGSLILKAPAAATVAFLADAEREVAAGSILLRLLHGPAALHAVAALPPQRVGLVHEGDPVVLKVATFPHYEWGVLEGVVRRASLTPDERGDYLLDVAITDTGRLGPHLQIGMTGRLSVLVERKSFFGFLFERLKKGYADVVEP